MTIKEMNDKKKELGLSYDMIAENTNLPVGTVQKVLGGITKSPRKATLDILSAFFSEENIKTASTKKVGRYFGTDGFRGKAGTELTAEHAFKIGRFLGWYYGQNNEASKIIIGKDTRLSSYMYESALASGIAASGGNAYLLHVTTTPCVSYIARIENFDCGVMISASHNPYFDNGIKLTNSLGEKMPDDVLSQIEDYLDGITDIPYATSDKIGKIIDYYFGRNKYAGFLTGLATKSFQNCKVGLDCANGSSFMLAKSVFDALGAKTYVINNNPSGTNVNSNCGSTHIEGLCDFVKTNHLDVGFAFDGDADRCLAVDENGEVVNGDKIMYVCAKYLKDRNDLETNTVVATVMSNMGLFKALDQLGIKYEKTAVGDRYVYENMKANGYMIGGEQSGHIIFREYANTGDGLITAIMIMNVLIDTQLPLSFLASPVKMYPQILKNVEVDDKDATLEDKFVIEAVKIVEKRLGESGRVLLRKSGTEPVLRVMSEADKLESANNAVDYIIDSMKRNNHLKNIRR